ncbi:MAG: hypothetical protein IJU44_01620 [Kiritimatiellae bacterium]|nr:hypothetical protein [Kiritimatiellia bacterium]
MTVAHVLMPERGVFVCRISEERAFAPGDDCLVELEYGRDLGKIQEIAQLRPQDMAKGRLPSFRVLRKQSPEDAAKAKANVAIAQKAATAFLDTVNSDTQNIKIIHARFSLNRNRLFIRYCAQNQLNLRGYLKPIEREYHTRIDLWQVGVRDAAAIIGCMGICGRPACCCTWQRKFLHVNLKMAKHQDISLNPNTVNGCCGRLKCCLRFEDDPKE